MSKSIRSRLARGLPASASAASSSSSPLRRLGCATGLRLSPAARCRESFGLATVKEDASHSGEYASPQLFTDEGVGSRDLDQRPLDRLVYRHACPFGVVV